MRFKILLFINIINIERCLKKVRSHLKLTFARDVKDNKKNFYHCFSLLLAVNKHWTRKKNPFMNETADLLTVNTNKTDLLNAFSVSVFSKKQSSSPPCLESFIRRRISSGWGADRDYVKVDDPFIKLSPRVLRNLVNVLSDISASCHLWKVKETGEDPHLCKHYTHLQKRQKGPSRKSANQLHFGPWKKNKEQDILEDISGHLKLMTEESQHVFW